MKLEIISNGKPYGTKIINADTGEELDDVLYVNIKMTAESGGVPCVEIGLTDVALFVSAEEAEFKPPGFTKQ